MIFNKLNLFLNFILLSFVFFSGCGSDEYIINDDDIFRVNSLYEYSIMMVDLSSAVQLK